MSEYERLHPKKQKKVKEKAKCEIFDGVFRECANINCRIMLEKDGGCNFVKCLYCKTKMCWVCGFEKGHGKGLCNDKTHKSH